MLFDFIWQFAVVVMLIVASAFFVAAEFALVRIRSSQLRPLLKTGDWRVRSALTAVQKLDASLSATQIGITIANLALGWIAEPFIHGWMTPVFAALQIENKTVTNAVSFILAFLVIPFVLIVFGELVPKLLAIQQPKAIALAISGPLLWFYYALKPFIVGLNATANAVMKLIGYEGGSGGEHTFSPDELDYLLTHSRHTHPGDALINKIMIRSLRLRETKAAQVMLPREQVIALWKDKSVEDNLRIAQSSGHSRFPVCEGSLDNVKGMVLVKEWLWQIEALGSNVSFDPLIRPVLTFTEKTPIHTLIELFRSSRSHLAVVLNDDGGIAGVLTIEDALEEIVGEIRDELDIEKGPIYDQSDNSILVDATLSVRELRAETGWNFDFNPKEQVGQWVTRNLKRLPKKGETVVIGEFFVAIPEIHANGPRRVRVTRMSSKELESMESGEINGDA